MFDAKRIDLSGYGLVSLPEQALPHEMEHVRLGPAGDLHCGWISDGFAQWELMAIRVDDRAYIRETCPDDP
jgi:hypothetical protein